MIDESQLDPSQQISLYTELIRIIEKDIDDGKEQNAREGWTLWGILGAIAAAGLLFFSETKNVTQFPVEAIMVCCVFIIAFHVSWATYNYLSGNTVYIKEKRIKSTVPLFRNKGLNALIKLFIYLSISYIIYLSNLPSWAKITSLILVFAPIAYMILSIFALIKTDRPMGNNPNLQKATKIITFLVFLSFTLAVLILAFYLPAPVGTYLTTAYKIGISLSIMIVLFEVLLTMAAPSEESIELKNLKDDLVFRRVRLNEGLNRYKILTEGKSLFEEMKEDYEKVMSFLYFHEDLYNQILSILKKFPEYAPDKDDTNEVRENKTSKTSELGSSFQIYLRQLQNSSPIVKSELETFYAKLNKVANASGDQETQIIIQQTIQRKFEELARQEQEMNALANDLQALQQQLGQGSQKEDS